MVGTLFAIFTNLTSNIVIRILGCKDQQGSPAQSFHMTLDGLSHPYLHTTH